MKSLNVFGNKNQLFQLKLSWYTCHTFVIKFKKPLMVRMSSKLFGAEFTRSRHKMKKERVKLTGAEKSELFAEGVVTVVLLLLLNLSIIILIHLAILQDESLVNGIYFLKKTITFAGGYHLWSWQNVFIVLMGV